MNNNKANFKENLSGIMQDDSWSNVIDFETTFSVYLLAEHGCNRPGVATL